MDVLPGMFASAQPAILAGLGSLRLRFQPIVALADGRLLGMEALARLSAPDGTIIEPAHFVPKMEQAGLAALLADQVSDGALAGIAELGRDQRMAGDLTFAPNLTVAINLPLEGFLAPDVLAGLDDARARHGVAPGCILVELTESQRVNDLSALAAAVTALRRAGYGVAIDDVVPDLPDLYALMELPFTCIKLDKSLGGASHVDGAADRFVDRMVAAAAARGMVTIAEGIEHMESWISLRDRGVTYAQGYWIARPLPPGELQAWMAAWRRRQLP